MTTDKITNHSQQNKKEQVIEHSPCGSADSPPKDFIQEELEKGCGMRESCGSSICKEDNLCYDCELKLAQHIATKQAMIKEFEHKDSAILIEDNLHTSFHGTFKEALKNGYKNDEHYVIVNWNYFHDLLKIAKERLAKLNAEKQKLGELK